MEPPCDSEGLPGLTVETTGGGPAVRFDYSGVDADVAVSLRERATRVRQLGRTMTVSIVEIGKELLAAKIVLPRQFGRWIAAEFGMSHSTALNFMRVAEHFATRIATVANLPARTLYMLAAPSTGETIRAAIIQRLDAGEPISPRQIGNEITRAREAESVAPTDREARRARERRISPVDAWIATGHAWWSKGTPEWHAEFLRRDDPIKLRLAPQPIDRPNIDPDSRHRADLINIWRVASPETQRQFLEAIGVADYDATILAAPAPRAETQGTTDGPSHEAAAGGPLHEQPMATPTGDAPPPASSPRQTVAQPSCVERASIDDLPAFLDRQRPDHPLHRGRRT